MNKIRSARLFAVGGALAVLMAACAGIDTVHTQAAPPRGGPAAAETPLTAAALAGVWRNEAPPAAVQPANHVQWSAALLQLSPDGSYVLDIGGMTTKTELRQSGTFRVVGRSVVLTSGYDGGQCGRGDVWSVQAIHDDSGLLYTVVTDDLAQPCSVGLGTEWTWTRVSPQSPVGAEITGVHATFGPGVAPTVALLRGVWLREGSGELIRLRADGTYARDANGTLFSTPADSGNYGIGSADSITFCGAGSPTCTECRPAFTDVRIFVLRFRATTVDGACGGFTPGEFTWVRLTP